MASPEEPGAPSPASPAVNHKVSCLEQMAGSPLNFEWRALAGSAPHGQNLSFPYNLDVHSGDGSGAPTRGVMTPKATA